MEITVFHKNLAKKEEEEFDNYLQQKISAIEKILTKFADDAPILKVMVEKFDKHDAFSVEFNLCLPSKSLVATETSHSLHKAIDLSKDRTIAQVKKHLAQLRKSREHASIRNKEGVKALKMQEA